jgi:hypothetical protein
MQPQLRWKQRFSAGCGLPDCLNYLASKESSLSPASFGRWDEKSTRGRADAGGSGSGSGSGSVNVNVNVNVDAHYIGSGTYRDTATEQGRRRYMLHGTGLF